MDYDLESIERAILGFEKKISKSTDENEKSKLAGYIAQIREKLTENIVNQLSLSPAKKSNKTENSSSDSKAFERNIKKISLALNDIPQYNGLNITETERYISKLNQFFTLLVSEIDPSLEVEFLSQIKLKLGDNVWKHLDTSRPDVSTFEKYKIFINTTYGGFQNAFQVVNRAFDIEFEPKEKFFIFSNKLTDELRTSLVAIKRHYGKLDGDKELTSNEVIDFMGALCVSQKLKEHHWEIFRDMTNDFDKLKTANEVAQKAEFYRERLQGAIVGSSSFWGKSEPKKPESNQKIDLNDPQFRAYAEKYDPNFKQTRPFKNWSERKQSSEKSQTQMTENKNESQSKSDNSKSTSFVTLLDEKSPFY